MRPAITILVVLMLVGCTAPACDPERLPHGGVAAVESELFAIAQHAARNECADVLYDLLSARTRANHGRTGFGLIWESIPLPEPYEDYDVADVVKGGVFDGALPAPGGSFMYVRYQERGGPELFVSLFVVREPGGLRLGAQEQVDSLTNATPDDDLLYFPSPPAPSPR